jgi:hypothetical protein
MNIQSNLWLIDTAGVQSKCMWAVQLLGIDQMGPGNTCMADTTTDI